MTLKNIALDDKYTRESGVVYMTGNQALVRLPMLQKQRDRAAGLNTAGYISGYRGSRPVRIGNGALPGILYPDTGTRDGDAGPRINHRSD